MWSCGVITYFLMAGFPPFMGSTLLGNCPIGVCSIPADIVDAITKCSYTFPSPYFDEVSPECKDFIRQLLVPDPQRRLTADQALQHPWLTVTAEVSGNNYPAERKHARETFESGHGLFETTKAKDCRKKLGGNWVDDNSSPLGNGCQIASRKEKCR
jgi:serine/threonine protein kinase